MSVDPAEPAAVQVEASQSTLDVIRLPAGDEEPEGEDYVQIEPHEADGFLFSGVVSIRGVDVDPGSRTSINCATGADGPFQTAEAAEAAAIEWAAQQGAETLYVLGSARASHLVGMKPPPRPTNMGQATTASPQAAFAHTQI